MALKTLILDIEPEQISTPSGIAIIKVQANIISDCEKAPSSRKKSDKNSIFLSKYRLCGSNSDR